MAEHDELARSIALARGALGAPSDARARVRARLAASRLDGARTPGAGSTAAAAGVSGEGAGAAAPIARAAQRRAYPSAWALTWVGLGLCAGYWLGFHRIGASWVEGPSPPGARDAARAGELAPATPPADLAPAAPASVGAPSVAAPSVALPSVTSPSSAVPVPSSSPSPPSRVARAHPPPRAARPAARRHGAGDLGAPRSGSADNFAAELALLERTERAIRAGEGELALALLDQLDSEFPSSSLREERAAARVLARCADARRAGADERAEARAGAERFLAHSSSVYAERVRELCELGPENE